MFFSLFPLCSFSLCPYVLFICTFSLLLSVPPERSKQERARCTLRVRQNVGSSHWAAGLASLRQVLAPSSMPCSITSFCFCLSRYRNQRSWLARCSVAEGGGNNKERDVTFLVSELMERIRDESDASPHAYGESYE